MKKENWILLDASEKILGRLASKIAYFLMGKDKVNYSSNVIIGDYVVVINSKKIKISGNKFFDKFYYKHSGYPGGMKILNFKQIFQKDSSFLIRNAVKGMLPKNKLQKIFLKRLKIYENSNHPHLGQKPILFEL